MRRFDNNPIIQPGMDGSIGSNINGPSLIRVPDWVENPLGKYYLYFADHKGRYIRLAYADQLGGPWQIYEPGCLQLDESYFLTETPEIPDGVSREALDVPRAPNVPSLWDDLTTPHIASPDVHVLDDLQEIRMYYHGLEEFGPQVSRVAVSNDGIRFVAREEIITPSYLRGFLHQGWTYGMVARPQLKTVNI